MLLLVMFCWVENKSSASYPLRPTSGNYLNQILKNCFIVGIQIRTLCHYIHGEDTFCLHISCSSKDDLIVKLLCFIP